MKPVFQIKAHERGLASLAARYEQTRTRRLLHCLFTLLRSSSSYFRKFQQSLYSGIAPLALSFHNKFSLLSSAIEAKASNLIKYPPFAQPELVLSGRSFSTIALR